MSQKKDAAFPWQRLRWDCNIFSMTHLVIKRMYSVAFLLRLL